MNVKYENTVMNLILISALVCALILSSSAIALDNDYTVRMVRAIESENIELIDSIIEGNNIKEIENSMVDGAPPIFYAASCYPDSLSRLIEAGFDINLIHIESKLRPVSLSVLSGDMECYEILKANQALNPLTFKEKYEIMDYSVMQRNQSIVDDLIGVDFNYLDDSLGVSAIELAIYHGRSYLFIPHIQKKVENGGLKLLMQ